MTHEDKGHYKAKHPAGLEVKPEAAEAVKEKASEGKISCAAAFKIARDLGLPPAEVGFTIDSLEIQITHCQMGIFGYSGQKKVRPIDTVPDDLKEAIFGSMVDGKLPCKNAWEIAGNLELGKMDIASACDTLEIKISSCQLGAFK